MHESRMRRWGTAGCHLWHLPVHTVLTKHVSSYGRRTGGCGAPVPEFVQSCSDSLSLMLRCPAPVTHVHEHAVFWPDVFF